MQEMRLCLMQCGIVPSEMRAGEQGQRQSTPRVVCVSCVWCRVVCVWWWFVFGGGLCLVQSGGIRSESNAGEQGLVWREPSPDLCDARPFFFLFTGVTVPRRSLSLKLSDTRVYEPQIRARLGTTAHLCKDLCEAKPGRICPK